MRKEKRYIAKYKYKGESEEFEIQSKSAKFLRNRLTDIADEAGKSLTYTIYEEVESCDIDVICNA